MGDKHIVKQYEEELRQIKEKIIRLGGLVEKQISSAMKAFTERDTPLAEKVIETDHVVNGLEVEIDELCIRLLALRQPAGIDLRLITTGIKIITDLERIGDIASNISERVISLNEHPPGRAVVDLSGMAEIVQSMLKDSIDAFINGDTDLAERVLKRDDEVDDLNREAFDELLFVMRKDVSAVAWGMNIISLSRNLERIADHATNIAEVVIFMVKGKVIRHMKAEDFE
ncbi:MAG: phosphate signaling complex protein PhoU [Nitrospinota bacterium]